MYKSWIALNNADVITVEESLSLLETPEWSLEQKDNEPVHLCGYFTDISHISPAWELLCSLISSLRSYTPSQETLQDTDWKNHYKEFLKPFQIGPLHIIPEWFRKNYTLPPQHHGIYLDAGLAFGTGAHETTQLCLRRLVDFALFHPQHLNTLKYIDAGCGSGILSLAAYKLGFRHILGCDTDPDAIRVSRENAQLNAIPDTAIDFQIADVTYGLLGRQANLISANILAPTLKAHAHLLVHTVAPGGTLSLSGILNTEVMDIQATFDPLLKKYWPDFQVLQPSLGEWAEIAYRYKSP
ncbi:MAG: 50S ribosomal protein L11 methyltransferase [Puniceicoccales bacterium]|jgi:ribosomal protein L11 methyltransferase|nr:50S ribosomal protein L11 methyltransferase [Puniceicoccales bacterium]